MKKVISILLSIAIIATSTIIAPIASYARIVTDAYGETSTYTYDSETRTLTIDGTGIIDNSCSIQNCSTIKHIVIHEGITEIQRKMGDIDLETLTLPDSLKVIGEGVFSESSELNTVHFGKNLEIIGRGAFCDSKIKTVKIPDSVTEIGDNAFSFCSIKKLTIGKNVKSIGKFAFYAIEAKKIVIPDSVTTIGEGAFADNCFLKSIKLSNNCEVLPKHFLFACYELKTVYVPDCVKKIGKFAIGYDSGLICGTGGYDTFEMGIRTARITHDMTIYSSKKSVAYKFGGKRTHHKVASSYKKYLKMIKK